MKSVLLTAIFALALSAGFALAAGGHKGGHGGQPGTRHGSHETMPGHSGGHESRAGQPGKALHAARTIDVVMGEPGEFRFDPASIEAKAGETVRLRVRNAGKVAHELVLGDMAQLREHAKMMRGQPAGMAHEEANSVVLQPGEQGELVWTFTQAGEFEFACLVPGHYEAGMKGTARVR